MRLVAESLFIASTDEDLIACIRALSEFSDLSNAYIPVMATETVINKLCSLLDKDEPILQQTVVKCLSTMFASVDPSVVETALIAGVLPRFTNILDSEQP